jgi:hypothetical protein
VRGKIFQEALTFRHPNLKLSLLKACRASDLVSGGRAGVAFIRKTHRCQNKSPLALESQMQTVRIDHDNFTEDKQQKA